MRLWTRPFSTWWSSFAHRAHCWDSSKPDLEISTDLDSHDLTKFLSRFGSTWEFRPLTSKDSGNAQAPHIGSGPLFQMVSWNMDPKSRGQIHRASSRRLWTSFRPTTDMSRKSWPWWVRSSRAILNSDSARWRSDGADHGSPFWGWSQVLKSLKRSPQGHSGTFGWRSENAQTGHPVWPCSIPSHFGAEYWVWPFQAVSRNDRLENIWPSTFHPAQKYSPYSRTLYHAGTENTKYSHIALNIWNSQISPSTKTHYHSRSL